MFDFLKTASRIFVILAIVSTILIIPVLAYLHGYQLRFSLNKHPFITFCIIGLLMLQPISFICLAVLTRNLRKNLFDYDLETFKRIKDIAKKETFNP